MQASMTQQQSALQAASIRANQLQLQHLTNHLGNLGHEVGRAIASHPVRHNHTIQATLSQPNVTPGQSNDSQVLGSLTRYSSQYEYSVIQLRPLRASISTTVER